MLPVTELQNIQKNKCTCISFINPNHAKQEASYNNSIDLNSLNIKGDIDKKFKHHTATMPLIGNDIIRVKDYLFNKIQNERYYNLNIALRNYTFYMLSINIGLRVGDLVSLKISDIVDKNGNVYDVTKIVEGKTKKERIITFVPAIKELLSKYICSLNGWKYDWYLFHASRPNVNPYKPITERSINKLMDKITEDLKFQFQLSSHTLRKTYARAYFDANRDNPMAIEILQKELGHSSPKITRAYIGIEMKDQISTRLSVGVIGM